MRSCSVRFGLTFGLAIAFVAVAAHPCGTEIYEWTEDDGVIHYSDDLTQVPEEYQGRVRMTESEAEAATQQAPPAAAVPAPPAQNAPPAATTPSAAEQQLAAEAMEATWREQMTPGRARAREGRVRRGPSDATSLPR